RGQSTRVRERTLRQLGAALGIKPDALCQTAEPERETIKLRIDSAARNSLTLVARRYRVKRECIIEAAPLLFLIAAEQSLHIRQKRTAEVHEAASSLIGLQLLMRHMPLPSAAVDEVALYAEEQSIKARDLFGAVVEEEPDLSWSHSEYDSAEHNP